MRAQVSLEFMLLLAAMAAFFLVVAPEIGKAAGVAKTAGSVNGMKMAFDKIVFSIEEAGAMGYGAFLRERLKLPADAKIFIERKELVLEFVDGRGVKKELRGALRMDIELPPQYLKAGSYLLEVENIFPRMRAGLLAEKG